LNSDSYYYADEEFRRVPAPFGADVGGLLGEMGYTPWREFEDDVGFQIKLFHFPEELADELVDQVGAPLEAAYVVVLSLGEDVDEGAEAASQAVYVRDLVSLYQVLT
jgi:hypothetical protein